MESERVPLVTSSESVGGRTRAQHVYGTLIDLPDDNHSRWKRLLHRFFPTGFWYEAKFIYSLAWPMYLSNLFNFLTGPISLIFSGHLGRAELDAVAMATSLINVTALSICMGLTTACDTLFSQAYGGLNKKTLGVYLQRSLIILGLACMPCWAIHLNTTNLLLVLGQDAEVARLAGDYMLIFVPAVLFTFLQNVLAKFLQNQGILKPLILIGLIANLSNILLQYILVYVLNMGIKGSAVCQVISYFLMLVLTFLYIFLWKKYEATWPGWTWKCLENWGLFYKLAICGMFMVILEWWSFEIGIFLSGILGTAQLGASSIVFQVESVMFFLSFSIGIANSIRIGHNLGAGNAAGAKTAAHASQVLSWLAYIGQGIIILSLMTVIPYIFTDDVAVAELTTSLLPILALCIFFDTITAVSMGTMRGAGRQVVGALVNLSGYFCLGLPLVAVLMFVIKIGVAGFWWGIVAGLLPSSIIYLILVSRMNWHDEVKKVDSRIRQTDIVSSVDVGGRMLLKSSMSLDDTKSPSNVILPNGEAGLSTSLEYRTSARYSVSFTGRQPDEYEDDTAKESSFYVLLWKRIAVVVLLALTLLLGILTRLFIPIPEAVATNTTLFNITELNSSFTDEFTLP